MRNVARAWAYETGVVVGADMARKLPYNDYYEYFGPDFSLDVAASNMDNLNTEEYLQKIKHQVFENLSRTQFAPSVQMQNVPADNFPSDDENEDDADVRTPVRIWDKRVVPENEFAESDDEDAGPIRDGKPVFEKSYRHKQLLARDKKRKERGPTDAQDGHIDPAAPKRPTVDPSQNIPSRPSIEALKEPISIGSPVADTEMTEGAR